MDFWGAEVKPGQTLDCDPGEDKYLHISQVAVGEAQQTKGDERVVVYVHSGEKKYAIGTLIPGKTDQFSLDVVFSKPFKLSHTSSKATICFVGYDTPVDMGDDFMEDSEESSDEEEEQRAMMRLKENGRKEATATVAAQKKSKQETATAKAGGKGKAEPPKPEALAKKESSDEDDDEEEEDESDEEDEEVDDEDEEMEGSTDEEVDESDDEEDEEESSEEEDEQEKKQKASKGGKAVELTPKAKPNAEGKKRPAPDSSVKTPATDKKAKLSGTPANNVKTPGKKDQTPKQGATPASGKKECTSCKR
eukprot:TRINITY_DN4963_c0_g1_i1.p1 TRINITY_DN4963_c0_g1~~TRINITY_DN4963_c0_g1_i1.p1  ORF type:complete len:306 (+),score=110.77 TRINITY_DN4963_c0_g1_i1:180-1097(+)